MNLSVIWKLQDLMTPTMNRIVRASSSAQAAIDRANAVMQNGFRRSADSAGSLREKIETLRRYREGLRIGIDAREIRTASSEISNLQRQLDRFDRRNNRASGGGFLAGVMRGGFGGIVAGAGIYGAIAAGQNLLNKSMDMSLAEDQFAYFTGNIKKAQQLSDQIRAYSEKYTMYNRSMLLNSATGIAEVWGSDKVMQLTTMIGKLAKGNATNFQGIMTRLQQVKGTGYLQGDELMELLNRGVYGVQEEIARFKGITVGKFYQLQQQRKISYQDVENALMRMTSAGGKYDKVLDVTMASARGKWSRITGYVENSLLDLAMSTDTWLTRTFDVIQRFIDRSAPIGEAFGNLGKAFRPLFDALYRVAGAFGIVSKQRDGVITTIQVISGVVNFLARIVNVAATAVSWLASTFEQYPWTKYAAGFLAIGYAVQSIDWIDSAEKVMLFATRLISFPFNFFTSGLTGLRMAWTALNTTMFLNPYVWIAAAIIAVGAAIYYAWNHSEKFRQVTFQVWEGVKAVVMGYVNYLMNAWEVIKKVYSFMIEGWRAYMNFIVSLALPVWNWVSEKFTWLGEKIGSVVDWVKDKFKGLWDGLIKDAADTVMKVANFFTFGLAGKGVELFKTGFANGKKVFDQYEKIRQNQKKIDNATGKSSPGIPGTGLPSFPSLGGSTGRNSKTGVTDTINNSASKQITINLNSPVANVSQYFGSSDDKRSASDLAELIAQEVNKIFLTGTRLALE